MPKVIHVAKAQKPNSVVSQEDIDRANAGEEGAASYYHWSMRTAYSSVKRYSKTPPKQSQLTLSEFWGNVYSLQEEAEADVFEFDNLEEKRNDYASRIREIGEECREKFENMPEGLQQGSSGELLEQRADSCESVADEIEGIDVPEENDFDQEEPEDNDSEEWSEWNDEYESWKDEETDRVRSEIIDALGNVEG